MASILRSKHHRAIGPEHPHVAVSHVDIGNVYQKQGRYEEALVEYEKDLDLLVSVHGQEHPDVANMYYNLACLYAARESTLCRDMLLKAEQTGYLYLLKEHMKTDSDMDPVRELEWYKDLSMRL